MSKNDDLKKSEKIDPFAQRTVSIGIQNLFRQRISNRLSQFYSSYATTKKSLFLINYFFLQK